MTDKIPHWVNNAASPAPSGRLWIWMEPITQNQPQLVVSHTYGPTGAESLKTVFEGPHGSSTITGFHWLKGTDPYDVPPPEHEE